MNLQLNIEANLEEKITFLIKKVDADTKFNAADRLVIKKAIQFGKIAHASQLRDTGDIYFIHPVRVAIICLEYVSDSVLICAALLHDVIEDTKIDLDRLNAEFNQEVADLVKALTKFKQEARAISGKRILKLAQKDLRVLLIKIADRLDNLSDICMLSRKRQRVKAIESIIFASVAEGIGLDNLADNFRNRSFNLLYPRRYKIVQNEIDKIVQLNEPIYSKIKNLLWSVVGPENCRSIEYHLKTPYDFLSPKNHIINILKKFTLLTDNVLECYHVLGVIHTKMRAVPFRFHDYIANPLANGWRGITTTVICYGFTVQIVITTTEFDSQNQKGIFSLISKKIYHHENYKEFIEKFTGLLSEQDVNLYEIFKTYNTGGQITWRSPSENFIQASTPMGKTLQFYVGATVLDFAFAIHSQIGLQCIGAIINQAYRVTPYYQIQEGDMVEIITDKDTIPDKNWLNKVVMPYSRKEIITYLKKHPETK